MQWNLSVASKACIRETYFVRLTFNPFYVDSNVSSCAKKKSQSSSSSSSSFKSSRESNVLPATGRSRVRDVIDCGDDDGDGAGVDDETDGDGCCDYIIIHLTEDSINRTIFGLFHL